MFSKKQHRNMMSGLRIMNGFINQKLEFDNLQIVQTIFKNPNEIKSLEPIEEGSGKG